MSRRTARRLALVVGAAALAAAVLASYVHATLGGSDEFAERAMVAFEQPVVREELTAAIVDRIIEESPDLIAVQPFLVSVVGGVLATDTASTLVRAGVSDVHRTLFTDEDTVLLEVSELILVAKAQVSALSPELGARIPDDLTEAVIDVRARAQTVDVAQAVGALDTWVLVLTAIALAAFVAVMWLAADVSTGLVGIGIAVLAAALAVPAVQLIGKWSLIDRDDPVHLAVWDAFVDPLSDRVIILGGLGTILTAIAWFGVGVTDFGARRAQLARVLRPRTERRDRVVWGVAMAVAGLYVIANPQVVLRFAITLVGVFALAVGTRESLAALNPNLVEGAAGRRRAATDAPADREAEDGRARRSGGTGRSLGRWVATSSLVAVAAVATAAFIRGDDAEADVPSPTGCNGSDELCPVRFDEVVMAATHNSHAAAAEGFLNGYQTFGIEQQLEDGIRGFLIDVYFGFEDGSRVITDRAPLDEAERAELVADIGEAAVAAAEATRASFEQSGVDADLYLCHALCEIGATPFVDELRTIKRFLDAHPREVIAIIVQDEGPGPADVAAAFEDSGLIELVHTQDLEEPFPTLGEMVDADRRVVVSAENDAGELDWYLPAFELAQDTRYDYESVDEFDCDLFRGDADNPVFLLNHWLNPVSPTRAAEVNDASVLLDRVSRCSDERGMVPNLIAVDFYDRGDLVAVVDQLD